ncbi:MAG: hypothetical protein ACJASL_003546 [Paraglaciecola sp.]|jgi:hypothetical protein
MNFYSKHKRYLGDRCLLNFKLKSSILLAALTSISLQAQDYEVEDTLPEQTQSEVMETEVPELAETQPEVMKTEAPEPMTAHIPEQVSEPMNIPESRGPTCPADFYTLPLYPNAKFCQLFAEQLPASMSYFAISSQQNTKDFYLEQLGQAEDETMLKGRIVLQYANGQKVVVISKDGQGSQIDILIKSAG